MSNKIKITTKMTVDSVENRYLVTHNSLTYGFREGIFTL